MIEKLWKAFKRWLELRRHIKKSTLHKGRDFTVLRSSMVEFDDDLARLGFVMQPRAGGEYWVRKNKPSLLQMFRTLMEPESDEPYPGYLASRLGKRIDSKRRKAEWRRLRYIQARTVSSYVKQMRGHEAKISRKPLRLTAKVGPSGPSYKAVDRHIERAKEWAG